MLKEGEMDAIKLEGGSPSRITAAKAIVDAGIAVIGHVGLTPQAISVLGGFRPQGKNVVSAVKVSLVCFYFIHDNMLLFVREILITKLNEGCGDSNGITGSWMFLCCS